MPEIVTTSSSSSVPMVPAARVPIAVVPTAGVPRAVVPTAGVRVATMADLPFMDALQKKHDKQLGYFPTQQFKGYIEMGAVLIAEVGGDGVGSDGVESSPLPRHPVTDSPIHRPPLGYVISRDRYLKRDELGVIYQLCVAPGVQRKLIGATLVKSVFERAAYGCRLFCCWCAQDLTANYFWESLGFVPLAFRAGSTGKRRVHIFWQRRIVEGDESTPLWYPFQTNSGAIREDRIVFPIPPGMNWRDVQAVKVPSRVSGTGGRVSGEDKKAISPPASRTPKPDTRTAIGPPPGKLAILVGGKIKYVPKPGYVEPPPHKKARKVKAEKPPAGKIDPKFLSAARELRDRYLERVNDRLLLPAAMGKYDVRRVLPGEVMPVRLLAAG